MSPLRPRQAVLLGLALAALALPGCNHNRVDDFPLELGFQPLEAISPATTWPAPVAGNPFPQGLGPVVAVQESGHFASHARGYLHAPLAKVYQALHDPAASYVHNDGGGTRLDGAPTLHVEDFPVSFRIRYSNNTIIGAVKFELTYRAGPLEGTEVDPLVIGERYQKTWGTDHIQVMEGSLVATAVDGAPEVTSVEMVAWLLADTQHQGDCDGTVRDLFGDLATKLASMP
jgi:hypothetical protein